MITGKAYVKTPNMNKLVRHNYFFKDHEKIQNALKAIKPVNSKCMESRREKSSKENKSCNIDSIKIIQEIDHLFDKYNKEEKSAKLQYKKMYNSNRIFHSSYQLLRSKTVNESKSKSQFDTLIEDYSQKNYKLPLNIIDRNIFERSPLLMTNSSELNLFYDAKLNNNNSDDSHKQNGSQYLDHLSGYLNYLKDTTENPERTYTSPFYRKYLMLAGIEDKQKQMKESDQYKKKIRKSEKEIKNLSQTITNMEENGNSFNFDNLAEMNSTIKDNNTKKMNYTGNTLWKSKLVSITQKKKNETNSQKFTWNSFSTSKFPKKKKSLADTFPITGSIRRSVINYKDKTLKKTNSTFNFNKGNQTLSSNFKNLKLKNTCSLKDMTKPALDNAYDRIKTLSLFNNKDLPIDIMKFFNEQNINIELM